MEQWLRNFIAEALSIWTQGGWAMIAIAVIAFVMFALGIHIYFRLSDKGYQAVPEKTWRRWIDHPRERRGPIGSLLDLVTSHGTLKEAARSFDEVRQNENASAVIGAQRSRAW